MPAQTAEDILAAARPGRGRLRASRRFQSVKITHGTVVTHLLKLEVVILVLSAVVRVEQSAPGQPPVHRAVAPAVVATSPAES